MSAYMLNDEDLMDAINPFVVCDFSLPGGVRKTGNFEDFKEVQRTKKIWVRRKSPYCKVGLCRDEIEPLVMHREVHPRRNIDTGFTCSEPKSTITMDVDTGGVPSSILLLGIIVLTLFVSIRS